MGLLETLIPHIKQGSETLAAQFERVISRLEEINDSIRDAAAEADISDNFLRLTFSGIATGGTTEQIMGRVPIGEIWAVDYLCSTLDGDFFIQANGVTVMAMSTNYDTIPIVSAVFLPGEEVKAVARTSTTCAGVIQVTRKRKRIHKKRSRLGPDRTRVIDNTGTHEDRVGLAAVPEVE